MKKKATSAQRIIELAKKCERKPPMPRPQAVKDKKNTYNRADFKAQARCW